MHPKNVVIIYMLFRIGILVIKQLLVAIDFHGMVVWGKNTMEVNSLKKKKHHLKFAAGAIAHSHV